MIWYVVAKILLLYVLGRKNSYDWLKLNFEEEEIACLMKVVIVIQNRRSRKIEIAKQYFILIICCCELINRYFFFHFLSISFFCCCCLLQFWCQIWFSFISLIFYESYYTVLTAIVVMNTTIGFNITTVIFNNCSIIIIVTVIITFILMHIYLNKFHHREHFFIQ